jgi:hypothetical protein
MTKNGKILQLKKHNFFDQIEIYPAIQRNTFLNLIRIHNTVFKTNCLRQKIIIVCYQTRKNIRLICPDWLKNTLTLFLNLH